MPKFGKKSLEVRSTLHPDLVTIVDTVVEFFDISLIEGHRTEARQRELFSTGKSRVTWPHSKHNKNPSEAVDIMPYHSLIPHIDWEHTDSINHLAGFVRGVAVVLFQQGKISHLVRWGGDWDRDYDIRERRTFIDSPHYELYRPV